MQIQGILMRYNKGVGVDLFTTMDNGMGFTVNNKVLLDLTVLKNLYNLYVK